MEVEGRSEVVGDACLMEKMEEFELRMANQELDEVFFDGVSLSFDVVEAFGSDS